jgi:hypothetical protein
MAVCLQIKRRFTYLTRTCITGTRIPDPLFPHLVPPAVMVWMFVWKYIFEPFIHILQYFVLQLSQVRGAHLKNCALAEGGAKNVRVFRVKKHDFTPKNHILSNCGGRREKCWGISCENHDFTPKNLHVNYVSS